MADRDLTGRDVRVQRVDAATLMSDRLALLMGSTSTTVSVRSLAVTRT
jgi:hypothetical protein